MKKYNICYNCDKRKQTEEFENLNFHLSLTCDECLLTISMTTKKIVFIYGLFDPRHLFPLPRYIGRSHTLQYRLNGHNKANSVNIPLNEWIIQLHKLGLEPIMKVIGVSEPKPKYNHLEEIWIYIGTYLKWPLLNMYIPVNRGNYTNDVLYGLKIYDWNDKQLEDYCNNFIYRS